MDPQLQKKIMTFCQQYPNLVEIKENENWNTSLLKLVTTYIYEGFRHAYEEPHLKTLRQLIDTLHPPLKELPQQELAAWLSETEIQAHNYYGSFLSDDSDSDDENEFLKQPQTTRQQKKTKSERYAKIAERHKLFYARQSGNYTKGDLKPHTAITSTLSNESHLKIPRPANFDDSTAKAELALINQRINNNEPPDQILRGITTKFMIAQYRGITYATDQWSQTTRRFHRNLDELNKPLYSHQVFIAAGIKTFRELTEEKFNRPEVKTLLEKKAKLLKEILLCFRENHWDSFNGYAFISLAHLLQCLYSQDYDGFHKFLEADPVLKDIFFNSKNPFVSTGDTPFHALLYAYGGKFYTGHKALRLRPRWKLNGRAERPYSGKAYVTLHSLKDYFSDSPAHVPTLVWKGFMQLHINIASEREASFPAYIPSGRVIAQHIAKFPSFDKHHEYMHAIKYGLDIKLFNAIKNKLASSKPHERDNIKGILTEWLCAFHEVKLIDIAAKAAQKENAVLLYNNHGQFSLTPPETATPMHSSIPTIRRTPTKTRNELRRSLTPTKQRTRQSLSPQTSNNSPLPHSEAFSHSMNTALSIMISAVKHQRTLALQYFLTRPPCLEVIHQTFTYKNHGTINLCQLAALLNYDEGTCLIKVVKPNTSPMTPEPKGHSTPDILTSLRDLTLTPPLPTHTESSTAPQNERLSPLNLSDLNLSDTEEEEETESASESTSSTRSASPVAKL